MCIAPMYGAAADVDNLCEDKGVKKAANLAAPHMIGMAATKITGQPLLGMVAKTATGEFVRRHPETLVRSTTAVALATLGPLAGAIALPFVAAKLIYDAVKP